MSFPRYPSYKPSGVEWLGEVPEHWEVKRFKHVFKEREERSASGEELLLSVSAYTGVSPRAEVIDEGDHLSRAESLEGYKLCYKDDLVVNIMLAWNRGLAFTTHQGIVSPAYCVYFVIDGSDPGFLNYLVRSDEYTLYFKAFSSGVIESRLRIYPDTFGRLFCGIPPLAEQTAIAAFLDRETGKIDALVAEQRRLMELLKEKRQAVISHAVTQGLNPQAPMKDSGIEWLGKVPKHWEVVPLKHLVVESVAGPYGASLTKAMYSTSGYRVYGQQQAITNDFAIGDYYITEEKYEEMRRYTVFPGDVLVSVMGTIGKVAVVPPDAEPGIINPRLVRYRCGDKITPRFMKIVLMSAQHQELLRLESNGSTMDGLNMQILGDVPILAPPLAEQEAIVAHLEVKLGKFDTLTAEAQRAIDLLQERRTALISAAVTGQIDVRA